MEVPPPRAARWEAYEDRNRLVADAEEDEEARWFERPWTEEERKVFADKFLLHHKVPPACTVVLMPVLLEPCRCAGSWNRFHPGGWHFRGALWPSRWCWAQ
jgi:hypothetical protein